MVAELRGFTSGKPGTASRVARIWCHSRWHISAQGGRRRDVPQAVGHFCSAGSAALRSRQAEPTSFKRVFASESSAPKAYFAKSRRPGAPRCASHRGKAEQCELEGWPVDAISAAIPKLEGQAQCLRNLGDSCGRDIVVRLDSSDCGAGDPGLFAKLRLRPPVLPPRFADDVTEAGLLNLAHPSAAVAGSLRTGRCSAWRASAAISVICPRNAGSVM